MIYNSILDTIGKTPIVHLNHIAPKHVDIYVKIEAFNPMASVKDRLASDRHAVIGQHNPPGPEQSRPRPIERLLSAIPFLRL